MINTNKSSFAGVAQLVEHHLAKVDVEGSNPFARSIHSVKISVMTVSISGLHTAMDDKSFSSEKSTIFNPAPFNTGIKGKIS